MKTCCTCKEELPLSAFNKSKANKDGHMYMCRECGKKKSKDRYYANREDILFDLKGTHRERHLQQKYGISEQEYDKLLTKQNGVCAICERKCTKQKNLCVDHDHETGKVRGLLCDNCNVGLGRFKDSLKLLLKAAEYLEIPNADKEGDFSCE